MKTILQIALDFVDLALGPGNGTLWAITYYGNIYSFSFNTTPPCGTWDFSLGDSSDGVATAIATPLNTPEFRDVAFPLAGMMSIFLYFRVRRRRTGPSASPADLTY